MKKLIILAVMTVLLAATAFAEDLSGMTDQELIALYQQVQEEMMRRGLPDGPETTEQAEIRKRVVAFFSAWNSNDPDTMMTMCDSGWRAIAEDPRAKLFGILANRTPQDVVIESVNEIAGEGPEGLVYYLVTVTSVLDRNNGTAPERYRLRFLVRKEEDGLWYINPDGLDTCEKAEEEIPAEETADPILYYQPDGGEYYHLDQNCRRVNPKYLPLQGSFPYAELNSEPYRHLKPCEICGAPPVPEGENISDETAEADPFHFSTFGEAVNMASGPEITYGITSEGYGAALIEKDGRYYRAVTFFDDRATELYAAYLNTISPDQGVFGEEEYQTLETYLMTLPVQYTEELIVAPLPQEELDAMAGKTIAEVMSPPWEMQMCSYPEDAEAGKDITFHLAKGFWNYDLVINESYEVYSERRAGDSYDPVTVMSLKNYEDLTVRYVKYAGISHNVLNLHYRQDGTREDLKEPEFEDYDLMVEIADLLAAAWENGEPGPEEKAALMAELTEEHPEAADLIRQMVESFHR